MHRSVVTRWRNRFAEHRLGGLLDEPRPGQPRKITDAQVEEVIVKTLETTPRNATHWSTRSMAKEVGLNQSEVQEFGRRSGFSRTAGELEARPSSSIRSVMLSGCI